MNASYRLGLSIVAGAVALSAAIVVAADRSGRLGDPSPAGRDLGDRGYELGPFRLTERSGRSITEADLADDVWVADFIFTRCKASCPRITAVMKGLQEPMARAGVRLVSLSVDPDHDTPAVLADYARAFGADPDRWWFLTGREAEIHALILDRFHVPIEKDGRALVDPTVEAVSHSDRLVLVDRGNTVVGFFDSGDAEAVRDLVAKARRRASWARQLPALNAGLNGSCAVLLVIGWGLIRARRARAHAVCMISAVAVSAVFLGCYLVYHAQVGSVSFRGSGAVRVAYLSILLSHTALATFGVVPLVALTLYRAYRRQFHAHASIARVTFPIWLYVSITGVVIYAMLYRLPVEAYS